ncbi:hypothetical protein FOCC_FOCC005297, partial [Frankliniella occidentalis]
MNSSSAPLDLNALNSDEREFNLMNILRANRNGNLIATTLERDGFLDDKPRKAMANILVHHIQKSNLEANPVLMREEMAILIVLQFPKMRKKLLKRMDMPWHHWFNANTNTGFLENANVGIQRSDKKLTGVGKRRSNKIPGTPRKLIELPVNKHQNNDLEDPDPPEFVRNVMEARNLMPTFAEKANIMSLMRETFERRRQELEFKEVSPDFTLDRYPHFLSYGGEVIEQEFSLIHPKSSKLFLRTFSLDFVPHILKIARQTPDKFGELIDYFSDELLNALLILSKLLPCPRRTYAHEAKQNLYPDTKDLIHIIPVGSDPSYEAAKRREAARCQVQPHLMIVGHQRAI